MATVFQSLFSGLVPWGSVQGLVLQVQRFGFGRRPGLSFAVSVQLGTLESSSVGFLSI